MKKAKIANLPKGVGVTKVISGHGKEYWRVRLGKRFTGGTVVQKDFSKLDDARKWIFGEKAEQLKAPTVPMIELEKAFGQSGFSLTPSQLGEVLTGLKQLESMGVTLSQAIELAKKTLPPSAETISLAEAMKQCGEEKERLKRSVYTLYDLKTRWKRFASALPAHKRKGVHLITLADVERFLKQCKLGPVAERNMVRAISSLFSWCVARKVMTTNPLLNYSFKEAKFRLGQDRAPRIVTLDEAKQLLRIARDGHSEPMLIAKQKTKLEPGEMIPYIALGLFAGLRPFEARRMQWEWIWWGDSKSENHDAHLDIPPQITKTGHGRTVPMEPALIEWLRPLRKEKGPIIPVSFPRKVALLSKLCWGKSGWPTDILRHSYASFLLARDKNSGAVAENLGHQQNTSTLFRYYRQAVKFRSDVTAFWNLLPCHPDLSEEGAGFQGKAG